MDSSLPIASSDSRWSDIVAFRTFVTPALITFIWVIGAILITLAGVVAAFNNFMVGLVTILVANLFWRVWMELFIVIFKIYGALHAIEKKA